MAPAPSEPTSQAAGLACTDQAAMLRVSTAGILGWLVPGLGHIFIGDRARGLVCLVTVTATFWCGVAIGGVRGTVDPKQRTLWFMAQLCAGGNAGVAYLLRGDAFAEPATSGKERAAVTGSWVSADIGVHYTGVAGLLNILVILDALGRAERPARSAKAGRSGLQGVT